MKLTKNESALANLLDFDINVLSTLKDETQNPINQGVSLNFENEVYGFKKCIISKTNKSGVAALKNLRNQLNNSEYLCFISEIKTTSDNELTVIKSQDKFDIINFQETNGGSFELTTKEIIEKLIYWDEKYSIDILGANYSWLLIEFRNDLKDLSYLTSEIIEFCPDINQAFNKENELQNQLKTNGELLFWWD